MVGDALGAAVRPGLGPSRRVTPLVAEDLCRAAPPDIEWSVQPGPDLGSGQDPT